MAIGLEMVQQPYQAALDAYIAKKVGNLEEADAALRRDTEWDERWGFEFERCASSFDEQMISLCVHIEYFFVLPLGLRKDCICLTWALHGIRYLPVLHFAREQGIRLMALNVASETIAKVIPFFSTVLYITSMLLEWVS